MGGKAAKERRRLKRLGLLSEDLPPSTNARTTAANAVTTQDENDDDAKKTHTKNEASGSSPNERRWDRGAPSKLRSGASKKRKGNEPVKPKKSKKPKHLKRKLEQLSAKGNDEERTKIEEQMEKLRKKKAKRAAAFERKVRMMAGDAFDEETFISLRDNGASLETILLASGAKKDSEPSANSVGGKGNKGKFHSRTSESSGEQNQKKKVDEEAELLSESGDNCEGDKEKIPKQEENKPTSNEKSPPENVDAVVDVDADADSDSDDELIEEQKRERGRRRRGRKDADSKRASLNLERKEAKYERKEGVTTKRAQDAKVAAEDVTLTKKTTKKEDKRRCIGRKPVSDFKVGKRYDGKIVYVKPFGAFIDVGCHSDAFCHVSRVRDEYVESITDVLSPGDEVSARVVEVDRKKKRLTVSLQTDARLEDEQQSAALRLERLKKNEKKKSHKSDRTAEESTENNLGSIKEQPSQENFIAPLDDIPESEMTHAQLKRKRKLERRAERRKQQELTGISS